MRIAVIGTGYVAQAYLRAIHFLGYHPLVLSRSWIDYYDGETLKFCLKEYGPDLVINCAGYTGETVDDCEKNIDESLMANAVLPERIALVCRKIGTPLIHISSGCMFNGGPFVEDSTPMWLVNRYQQHKFIAESLMRDCGGYIWTFRIRMPFNHLPHPRNWLMKLIKYPRILDGLNSVTFLDQFCMRSFQLVMRDRRAAPGIYHACESEPVWTKDIALELHGAGLREFPRHYEPEDFLKHHVPRSAAVLDSSKFERAYGEPFGDPHCAIRWCIEQLKGQLTKALADGHAGFHDQKAHGSLDAGAVDVPIRFGSGNKQGSHPAAEAR